MHCGQIWRAAHSMSIRKKLYAKSGSFEFQSLSRSNIFLLAIISQVEIISSVFNHDINEILSPMRVAFLRFLNKKVMSYGQILMSGQVKHMKTKVRLGHTFPQ